MGEGSETIEALPKTTSCKGQCQSETVQLGFLGNGEPKNYIFFVCLFSTSVRFVYWVIGGKSVFRWLLFVGTRGWGSWCSFPPQFLFFKKMKHSQTDLHHTTQVFSSFCIGERFSLQETTITNIEKAISVCSQQ